VSPIPRKSARRTTCFALCAALCAVAAQAVAAPEEIQVYLDDATAPGHFGLDIHNNLALSGLREPDYPGARASEHVYRLTPEFYYGLAPGLELGAYLLSARDATGEAHVDGAKLRLKYIAPHDAAKGAFWGLNLEVGKSSLAVAERPWNYELKAITGLRRGPWLLACNLDLDGSLSAHGGPVELAFDTKVSHAVGQHTQLGIETYSELGPVNSPGGLSERSQMLYAVVDTDLSAFDLSFGVGRGLTHASDPWMLKAILGFQF
jgi:hypothetical protein